MNEIQFAIVILDERLEARKDLLKHGHLLPLQENDLKTEIRFIESAIRQIKSKFNEQYNQKE
jgi:hypothetical protein